MTNTALLSTVRNQPLPSALLLDVLAPLPPKVAQTATPDRLLLTLTAPISA